MVRLKDNSSNVIILFINISIPYGAIKRMRKFSTKFVEKIISIPYGAIKRICLDLKDTAVNTFQFLMVRLKDKRAPEKFGTLPKFQFLMVRLKATHRIANFQKRLHFNSLWCD